MRRRDFIAGIGQRGGVADACARAAGVDVQVCLIAALVVVSLVIDSSEA